MTALKTVSAIITAVVLAGPVVLGAAMAERATVETTPIAKSDRIAAAFDLVSACPAAAWPKVTAECVTASVGYRMPTRSVTVERRDEANQTSVLVRMPVVEIAAR